MVSASSIMRDRGFLREPAGSSRPLLTPRNNPIDCCWVRVVRVLGASLVGPEWRPAGLAGNRRNCLAKVSALICPADQPLPYFTASPPLAAFGIGARDETYRACRLCRTVGWNGLLTSVLTRQRDWGALLRPTLHPPLFVPLSPEGRGGKKRKRSSWNRSGLFYLMRSERITSRK